MSIALHQRPTSCATRCTWHLKWHWSACCDLCVCGDQAKFPQPCSQGTFLSKRPSKASSNNIVCLICNLVMQPVGIHVAPEHWSLLTQALKHSVRHTSGTLQG